MARKVVTEQRVVEKVDYEIRRKSIVKEEPILELNNVEVVYDKYILVLKGLSMSIRRGSITALLGPNGAGKSTTLKAISGLLKLERGEVTRGHIRFNGENIENRDPLTIVRKGIVHVLENRHVFEELTVKENLVAASYLSPTGKVDFDYIYNYFPQLKLRENVRAGYLSGGEQQMLAIARALVAKPKLLLLDEPSLGLAPKVVDELYGIIKRINEEEGITILLVEQNATVAFEIADYGYIMENGRIVLDGEISELRENEDVKEFYMGLKGSSRKNFRSAKYYKRKKRWY